MNYGQCIRVVLQVFLNFFLPLPQYSFFFTKCEHGYTGDISLVTNIDLGLALPSITLHSIATARTKLFK